MAFSSGINGKLYLGGTLLGQVKNWQWSTAQTLLDTTYLSDTDKTVAPGLRTTTGSCSLHYYGQGSSAGTLINKIVKTGGAASTQVTFKLEVDGKNIEVPAFISNASMSCAVGEVVSVEINFEANGSVTSMTL